MIFLFLVNLKMDENNMAVFFDRFCFFRFFFLGYPAFVRIEYPVLGSAIMQHSHLCHIIVALSSYGLALLYFCHLMTLQYELELFVLAVLPCQVGR